MCKLHNKKHLTKSGSYAIMDTAAGCGECDRQPAAQIKTEPFGSAGRNYTVNLRPLPLQVQSFLEYDLSVSLSENIITLEFHFVKHFFKFFYFYGFSNILNPYLSISARLSACKLCQLLKLHALY